MRDEGYGLKKRLALLVRVRQAVGDAAFGAGLRVDESWESAPGNDADDGAGAETAPISSAEPVAPVSPQGAAAPGGPAPPVRQAVSWITPPAAGAEGVDW